MKYEYNAPPGSCIQGFFGRSDKYLSAIGVILKRAPRRRRQQGPSKVTSTVGQSSISGIISGNRQYAKKVGITSVDIPGYRSEANVDVNGRYKFSNLRNGRYRVYPIPGGKFSLISEPEYKIVNCEGSSSYTINFKIISIMEG
jgi:hypothetical protein